MALAQADPAHASLDNKYLVLGKGGTGWTPNHTTHVNSRKKRLPVLVTSSVFAREENVRAKVLDHKIMEQNKEGPFLDSNEGGNLNVDKGLPSCPPSPTVTWAA